LYDCLIGFLATVRWFVNAVEMQSPFREPPHHGHFERDPCWSKGHKVERPTSHR
jgi:hypothetical protein